MQNMKRRSFIKHAGAGAMVMAAPFSRVLGANNDVRLAIVGVGSNIKIGGRGKQHVAAFNKVPGTRVVALCDPDPNILGEETDKLRKANMPVQTFSDVRKLLESKEIDAISVTTPNHWHALATIWGCQAGMDVYVEKPISHTLREGRKMIEAAEKYNRIAHTGLSSKSSAALREAKEYIHSGKLGKIKLARAINYKRRPSIGKVSAPTPVPQGLDYNLWCGPAPQSPIQREFLHYDWHWVWETGDGDIGNMGVHMVDCCRWLLGEDRLAPSVLSIGGRVGYDDDGVTPNTQVIMYDYKSVPILFEAYGLPLEKGSKTSPKFKHLSIGVVIECENGYLTGEGNGSQNPTAWDLNGNVIKKFEGSGNNYENFITAVRDRKSPVGVTDVRDGHLSTGLCHMGNISHRVGKEATPDQIRDAANDDNTRDAIERMREHLARNGVDIAKTNLTLGSRLELDTDAEQFVGGRGFQRANRLALGRYREPFVVRDEV